MSLGLEQQFAILTVRLENNLGLGVDIREVVFSLVLLDDALGLMKFILDRSQTVVDERKHVLCLQVFVQYGILVVTFDEGIEDVLAPLTVRIFDF